MYRAPRRRFDRVENLLTTLEEAVEDGYLPAEIYQQAKLIAESRGYPAVYRFVKPWLPVEYEEEF